MSLLISLLLMLVNSVVINAKNIVGLFIALHVIIIIQW